MEHLKTTYEIRYAKLLNFREIYKDIINSYFKLPGAKYTISNEGLHNESIRMTFPNSYQHLYFGYDRIMLQHEGSIDELENNGSNIDWCFDIFNELKKVDSKIDSLVKGATEVIELIAFKEVNEKTIEKFVEKYKIQGLVKETKDVAIVLEGIEKEIGVRLQFGSFAQTDLDTFSLFSFDRVKYLEFQDKQGILVKCTVKKESAKISKRSFSNLSKKCIGFIEKIIVEHE